MMNLFSNLRNKNEPGTETPLCVEKEFDLLTDTTEIIFYEMPKLDKKVNEYFSGNIKIENLSAEEKWCIFFKYHHEKQVQPLIKELCRKEEGIMRAEKQVDKLPRSYIRAMTVELDRAKNNIDRILMQNAAYEKGIAEGIEKGQVKGQLEYSRKMKALGDSDEKINAVTGLEIEVIRGL